MFENHVEVYVHLIAAAGLNTNVYQHKYLSLVLRGKYYQYYVVVFGNKHKSKRKRIVKKD